LIPHSLRLQDDDWRDEHCHGTIMNEPCATAAIIKIPPPIWMFLMLVAAYAARSFGFGSEVVLRYTPAAILLAAAGIALAVSAGRSFIAAGTEFHPASSSNKALVVAGPFHFSRNPMYLSLIVVAIGVALYFGTLPFYAVPVLLFLLTDFIFIPFEEAKMSRQFGTQYTDYCASVRRWL
jgi:protein-S-isoprenylcysteine O-methyltransferase Ste14